MSLLVGEICWLKAALILVTEVERFLDEFRQWLEFGGVDQALALA